MTAYSDGIGLKRDNSQVSTYGCVSMAHKRVKRRNLDAQWVSHETANTVADDPGPHRGPPRRSMNRRRGTTIPARIVAMTEPVPPSEPSRTGTLTDSELLAAVAARSTAAMAELHERYGTAMHCLAVAIVGNHHAERVVHAALLAVWRQPAKPATAPPVQ